MFTLAAGYRVVAVSRYRMLLPSADYIYAGENCWFCMRTVVVSSVTRGESQIVFDSYDGCYFVWRSSTTGA